MANNLSSNVVEELARIFLEKFEASRVVSKTVDTQLLQGKYTNRTGGTVSVKRPHDYNTIRTPGGDISLSTKSDILAGKATGVVQDYFTVATEWDNIEEALELDQLDQIIAPMATRIVTDMEVSLAGYVRNNAGLSYGDPDTAVTKWSDVAGAGALMDSVGVPSDMERFYIMNPFTNTALADTQSGLASGDNKLVTNAWTKAQISDRFGGLQSMTSNALSSLTTNAITDRAGTLTASPDATYVTHKDTMIQSIAVTAFTASLTIKAGEIIEITASNRINIATRENILDDAGAQIPWRGVVTADVPLNGSGAGTLLVAGPALLETDGQHDTVDRILTSGDVITLLGTASTVYVPNLFYHKQAFGMASIELPKLFSTDTVATTEDGMSIRVSKYADGDANVQKVRFDFLPAFVTFNPFFGGQGFGRP